jgi:esterase/lipase
MVLFILFPGLGHTKNDWNFDRYGEKLKFISELKKLGDVYTYTPKMYNTFYYAFDHLNTTANKFDKDIDFNLDYLNLEKHCRLIYKDIKDHKSKIIVIGHSIGAYFAYKFAEIFKSKCLACIIIDGCPITKNAWDSFATLKKVPNSIKKMSDKDLKDNLQIIKNKYKNNDKTIKSDILKIYNLYVYHLEQQYNTIDTKFNIPTYLLTNIEVNSKNPDALKNNIHRVTNNEELEKLNPDKVKVIYYVNKSHYIHHNLISDVLDIAKNLTDK